MVVKFKKAYFLIFLFVILFISSIPFGNAQSTQLKSNTMTSIGIGTVQVENFIVQQSIGQSSVIGSFKIKGIYAFQGFLNGTTKIKKFSELPLKIIAYPNSFVSEVNFRFVPGYIKEVLINIFDSNGKSVFQGMQIPIKNEVKINLEGLSAGLYFVVFNYENTFSQTKLIKL